MCSLSFGFPLGHNCHETKTKDPQSGSDEIRDRNTECVYGMKQSSV